MPKVEVIRVQKREKQKARIRVAAYCRVSTDSEEQETSYEAQCVHYKDMIAARPDWELADIYADEGYSGTQVRGRKAFGRMIADCKEGKIDLVVTKSISRFARNTLDCIRYIRELRTLGIPILFEKEGINTMDAKGELLITIMASIAQEESQSISQNVRLGIQYRMQQGKGRVNYSILLGLTRDESGKLVPVPGEADVVRAIFRALLDGDSPGVIAKHLDAYGCLSPSKKAKWSASSVRRILTNEKYQGDLLLQKYYVTDFLSHKVTRNTGHLPLYYVPNAHDPVVPRRAFEEAQGELYRRAVHHFEKGVMGTPDKGLLYGRLVCALCGRRLRRCVMPDGRVEWQCRLRDCQRKSRRKEIQMLCPLPPLSETEAWEVVYAAFERLPEKVETWILPRLEEKERELGVLQMARRKPEASARSQVPSGGKPEGIAEGQVSSGGKPEGIAEGRMPSGEAVEVLHESTFREPWDYFLTPRDKPLLKGDREEILALAELRREIFDLRGLLELAEEIRSCSVGDAEDIKSRVGDTEDIKSRVGDAEDIKSRVGDAEDIKSRVGDAEDIKSRDGGMEGRHAFVEALGGAAESPSVPRAIDSPSAPRAIDSPSVLRTIDSPSAPRAIDSPSAPRAIDSPPVPRAIESPSAPRAIEEPSIPRNFEGPSAACGEYDDFLQRTRLHLPKEWFGEDGHLGRMDDLLGARYLQHLFVGENVCRAEFRAGLSVEVRRGWAAEPPSA